jgi:hypothetical protein
MRTTRTVRLLTFATCLLAALMVMPSASAHSGSAVVQRIDARIAQAEQQTLRWDARVNGWQARVAKTARRLELVLAHPSKRASHLAEYYAERHPGRLRPPPPNPLEQARAALRSALGDPKALEAKEQATTWRRYMVRLKAAQRAALAAGHGAGVSGLPSGPITYANWARALLSSLRAPACRSSMRVVVAWETAESTLARYNPLATTYALPGAVSGNSSGVQNYVSYAQGVEAARNTLLGDPGSFHYANIVDDLLACAPAEKTATAVWESSWCAGCARGGYLLDELAAVQSDWANYATRLVSTY